VKLIADATIDLPFTLDYCAQGPDVTPLTCRIDGYAITVYFPPSLSETTDGQGIFGDWAWWTGRRLRVYMEREVASVEDAEHLRETAIATGDEVLRRLLNAYRVRFGRPDIYPVRIDPRALELSEVLEDGTVRGLLEPVASFFYQSMPSAPPLKTSINTTTLEMLARDVQEANEPSVATQLELDAEALDAQGEYLRADLIRGLARQQV